MHPKNRYQGRYHIAELLKEHDELARFAKPNQAGEPSIDFANPDAVLALNRALLKQYYGIQEWNIPEGYLCPPIPGRADYIHLLADLHAVNLRARGISETNKIQARVLDVGTGANLIYPIIGVGEYGWRFVGSDVNPEALESAQKIIEANESLKDKVELRHQKDPDQIFESILLPHEQFELTMCNPPFHASAFEAAQVNQKKWKNLGKAPVANFGGQHPELWCEGGEVAFVSRMIQESQRYSQQVLWFTSLISKESSLKPLYAALSLNDVKEYRVMDMHQGQKKSRILAWTYLGGKNQSWRES